MHHIVLGGDYGYRFRNGRRGIHPFTSWNGELPGTLPMVAGTGEAPSGIIHIASDALGKHNRDVLIGTSWGDHRLERFRLEPRGASFHSQPEPIVTGGEDFRPVGVAMDKLGNLWVTDWVDKSYNVHGKGRIWRVRAKERPKTPVMVERPYQRILTCCNRRDMKRQIGMCKVTHCLQLPWFDFRAARSRLKDWRTFEIYDEAAAELLRRNRLDLEAEYLGAIESNDAFIFQAALVGLKSRLAGGLDTILDSKVAAHRLAGVLVHRLQMQDPQMNPLASIDLLPPRFKDSDPAVQFASVQTVGELRIKSLRPHIVKLLESGKATGRLFLACTATLDDLDRVKKNHSDEFNAGDVLIKFVVKPNASPSLIREALPFIPANHPALKIELLDKLLSSSDADVRRVVLQSASRTARQRITTAIAQVPCKRSDSRSESRSGAGAVAFERRFGNRTRNVGARRSAASAPEALRSLRHVKAPDKAISELEAVAVNDPASRELIDRIAGKKPIRPAPIETAAWLKRLEGPADAEAGRRIFFHPYGPGCFKCHRVGDRGGLAGPDLSAIGGTMTRERIVESILNPNKEVAPMFTPWTIAPGGRHHEGRPVYGRHQQKHASLRRRERPAVRSPTGRRRESQAGQNFDHASRTRRCDDRPGIPRSRRVPRNRQAKGAMMTAVFFRRGLHQASDAAGASRKARANRTRRGNGSMNQA